jgi:hypothetical protein
VAQRCGVAYVGQDGKVAPFLPYATLKGDCLTPDIYQLDERLSSCHGTAPDPCKWMAALSLKAAARYYPIVQSLHGLCLASQ